MTEDNKQKWISARAYLENKNYKKKRSGKRRKSRWSLFTSLLRLFVIIMKILGLYRQGICNVRKIEIIHIDLHFNNLPENFNDYKILQLSDLHIDSLPGLEDTICDKIKQVDFDICVMTGDYRKNNRGSFDNIIQPLKKISNITRIDEIPLVILGNHDSYQMIEKDEKLGMRFLINETISIKKGNEEIFFTGTDDPFRYFTKDAIRVLEKKNDGFKIALVHTSELTDIASSNNYNLYLCGHTHGGQICLPGGKPIITHQFKNEQVYKGLWEQNGMKVYTSKGCGVSGIPMRFNCPGEITVFRLLKAN